MNSETAVDLSIDDFSEGQSFSFEKTINESEVARFAELSGDCNPLHMDNSFAEERGFQGRVPHGLLLASYFSKLVGMHLPGKNALLHSVNIKFLHPAYLNDNLVINGVIDHVSLSTQTLILKATITNTNIDRLLAKGTLQVGLTNRAPFHV